MWYYKGTLWRTNCKLHTHTTPMRRPPSWYKGNAKPRARAKDEPEEWEQRLMSTSNLQVEASPEKIPPKNVHSLEETFEVTLVDPPSLFVSAYRQIRDWFREPKMTVPAQYY